MENTISEWFKINKIYCRALPCVVQTTGYVRGLFKKDCDVNLLSKVMAGQRIIKANLQLVNIF